MRAKSGASSSFCLLFLAFAFSIFDSLFEFLASSRASAHFFAHFAPQHEHDHLLVGPPGPQRMLERCRAVVLDEKVRDPRQRVRNHKRGGNPPPPLHRESSDQQRPPRQRPRKVYRSRTGLAVRAHILRPEVSEAWFGGHGRRKWKIENGKTTKPACASATRCEWLRCPCREREVRCRAVGANPSPARSRLVRWRPFQEESWSWPDRKPCDYTDCRPSDAWQRRSRSRFAAWRDR